MSDRLAVRETTRVDRAAAAVGSQTSNRNTDSKLQTRGQNYSSMPVMGKLTFNTAEQPATSSDMESQKYDNYWLSGKKLQSMQTSTEKGAEVGDAPPFSFDKYPEEPLKILNSNHRQNREENAMDIKVIAEKAGYVYPELAIYKDLDDNHHVSSQDNNDGVTSGGTQTATHFQLLSKSVKQMKDRLTSTENSVSNTNTKSELVINVRKHRRQQSNSGGSGPQQLLECKLLATKMAKANLRFQHNTGKKTTVFSQTTQSMTPKLSISPQRAKFAEDQEAILKRIAINLKPIVLKLPKDKPGTAAANQPKSMLQLFKSQQLGRPRGLSTRIRSRDAPNYIEELATAAEEDQETLVSQLLKNRDLAEVASDTVQLKCKELADLQTRKLSSQDAAILNSGCSRPYTTDFGFVLHDLASLPAAAQSWSNFFPSSMHQSPVLVNSQQTDRKSSTKQPQPQFLAPQSISTSMNPFKLATIVDTADTFDSSCEGHITHPDKDHHQQLQRVYKRKQILQSAPRTGDHKAKTRKSSAESPQFSAKRINNYLYQTMRVGNKIGNIGDLQNNYFRKSTRDAQVQSSTDLEKHYNKRVSSPYSSAERYVSTTTLLSPSRKHSKLAVDSVNQDLILTAQKPVAITILNETIGMSPVSKQGPLKNQVSTLQSCDRKSTRSPFDINQQLSTSMKRRRPSNQKKTNGAQTAALQSPRIKIQRVLRKRRATNRSLFASAEQTQTEKVVSILQKKPVITFAAKAQSNPWLIPKSTYYSSVDGKELEQPKPQTSQPTRRQQRYSMPEDDAMATSISSHYKLTSKRESYSQKGYGVGFVSQVDRFSGINESKFNQIVPNAAIAKAVQRTAAVSAMTKPLTQPSSQSPSNRDIQTVMAAKTTSLNTIQSEVSFARRKAILSRVIRDATTFKSTSPQQRVMSGHSYVLKSQRQIEKKQRGKSNIQAVIQANKDKLRKGLFVGRSLATKLPFPDDVVKGKKCKLTMQQKTIPKMYQTMTSGFKSLQPRFVELPESKVVASGAQSARENARQDVPGPGSYEITVKPGELQSFIRQKVVRQKHPSQMKRHQSLSCESARSRNSLYSKVGGGGVSTGSSAAGGANTRTGKDGLKSDQIVFMTGVTELNRGKSVTTPDEQQQPSIEITGTAMSTLTNNEKDDCLFQQQQSQTNQQSQVYNFDIRSTWQTQQEITVSVTGLSKDAAKPQKDMQRDEPQSKDDRHYRRRHHQKHPQQLEYHKPKKVQLLAEYLAQGLRLSCSPNGDPYKKVREHLISTEQSQPASTSRERSKTTAKVSFQDQTNQTTAQQKKLGKAFLRSGLTTTKASSYLQRQQQNPENSAENASIARDQVLFGQTKKLHTKRFSLATSQMSHKSTLSISVDQEIQTSPASKVKLPQLQSNFGEAADTLIIRKEGSFTSQPKTNSIKSENDDDHMEPLVEDCDSNNDYTSYDVDRVTFVDHMASNGPGEAKNTRAMYKRASTKSKKNLQASPQKPHKKSVKIVHSITAQTFSMNGDDDNELVGGGYNDDGGIDTLSREYEVNQRQVTPQDAPKPQRQPHREPVLFSTAYNDSNSRLFGGGGSGSSKNQDASLRKHSTSFSLLSDGQKTILPRYGNHSSILESIEEDDIKSQSYRAISSQSQN